MSCPTLPENALPGTLAILVALATPVTALCQVVAQPAGDALNPRPYITSVSPEAVPPDRERIVIVYGSSFVDGARVRLDGQNRTTYFRGSKELRFHLLTGDATLGVKQITVFSPEPGGGLSDPMPLSVEYPVPVLNSLEPSSVVAGAQDGLDLRLSGGGWQPVSRVHVAGLELAPFSAQGSYLRVRVPADALGTPGRLSVHVTNPTPGGGTSETRELEVLDPDPPNPVPTLTSLEPGLVLRPVTAAVPVRVLGSGFVEGSRLVWRGVERDATFVSQTELRVEIPATTLEAGPFLGIRVRNPEPGGGDSSGRNLVIQNPAPSLARVEPEALEVMGSTYRLRVIGSGFVREGNNFGPGSVARWNGEERSTTYRSFTELEVELRVPGDLESPGTGRLSVFNSSPGGGTSSEVAVEVRERTPANPVPVVASVEPDILVRLPTADVPIRVRGSGFVQGTEVLAAGMARPTSFVSDTELTSDVPAAHLRSSLRLEVRVRSPAPGGGDSNGLLVPVHNDSPRIERVEPATLDAESPGARLRVTGTGFVPDAPYFGIGSRVRWNGAERPTTYRSPTEVEVDLSADDLAGPGTGRLSVLNRAPGGGTSAEASVEVRGAATEDNPAPSVAGVEIGPAAGIPGWTLVVRGSGFVPASVVRWDGRELETTFVSEAELRARVPPGQANPQRGDVFTVTVWSPVPGGGTSPGVSVTVPR